MAKTVKKEAPAAVKTPVVKTAAEKPVEAVKAPAVKEAPKAAAKKVAPKKAPAVKKAAAPAKEKAVKAPKTAVYVEYYGQQVDLDKLVASVKAQVGSAKDLQIYVKPEDHAVYYVANGDTIHGKVDF